MGITGKTKPRSVLLIAPRYSAFQTPWHRYWFPLGLAYISAAMKKAGHDVDCLNLNHLSGPTEQLIRDALSTKRYDAVGTGGNAIHFRGIKDVIDSIRARDNRLITICGGPMITSEPELIFTCLAPTYGVLGEGEETIVELLAHLEEPAKLQTVPGLIFRDGQGQIRTSPTRTPAIDINDLPYPDLDSLGYRELLSHSICNDTPWNSFYDEARCYYLMGSRGCPYNCTFCWHYSRHRKRTIDDIIDELSVQIPKYRINNVILLDECFSVSKERVYEFCDKFEALRRTVPWNIGFLCQLTARGIDRDLLMRLKRAGCHSVSFGFESYSEDVLRSMKKPIRPRQIDTALQTMFDVGLLVVANFIFGDVAETLETARTTLAYWRDQCLGQVNIAYLQAYPGSKLFNYCAERGIIPDKISFIETKIEREHRINMSQTMTDSEYQTMCQEIEFYKDKYSPRVFVHITSSNGVNHKHIVRLKCPFCHEINKYRNVLLLNSGKVKFGKIYNTRLACRRCSKHFVVTCCDSILMCKLLQWQGWLKPFLVVWRYGRRLSHLVIRSSRNRREEEPIPA